LPSWRQSTVENFAGQLVTFTSIHPLTPFSPQRRKVRKEIY
jgi:hypothetical protein